MSCASGNSAISGYRAVSVAPQVNSAAAANAENNNNNNSPDEKSFSGPWGLFKFFDASNPQKQTDNSYLLSYKLKSGKSLTAKITPSGGDQFNKDLYKLRAPKTILK